MNFLYKHRDVPTLVGENVRKELQEMKFNGIWNLETIPRPYQSLVSYVNMVVPDVFLLEMSVVHLSASQSIGETYFPSKCGDVVALVVLGSSIQITLSSMGSSLRVSDGSILILENIRGTKHSLVSHGDCYMVMLSGRTPA
jgi:hypothetical protein